MQVTDKTELSWDGNFELLERDELTEAVGRLACNELIIAHNKTVYAVVGNAHSPSLLDDIRQLKGDPDRNTVGWTVPFSRAWPAVDTSGVIDPAIRKLLDSSDEVTRRYAGLGFLRLPADAAVAATLPEGMINEVMGTVQPYSPSGNDFTSRFLRYACSYGVEPVMSSANFHGQPEIVLSDEAHAFAEQDEHKPLFVLEDDSAVDLSVRPLGSYPIVTLRPDHLEISREGCFSAELVQRLFAGYDVDTSPSEQSGSHYIEHRFGLEDLPPRIRALEGEALRLGLLATLGWQSDAADQLHEMLGEEPAVL